MGSLRNRMLGKGGGGGGTGNEPGELDMPLPLVPPVAPGIVPKPIVPPPMPFPHLQGRIENIQGMLASGLNRAGNPMGRPDFWQNRLSQLQGRLSNRMMGQFPPIEFPHGMR